MSDITPDLTAPGDDLVIDFTDVQVKSFEGLPSGWYSAEVVGYEDVETKNAGKLPAGTPGINWEFQVTEGKYTDRRLWTNHWLAPSTLGFLKGLMEATRAFEEGELEGQITRADIDKCIGCTVDVKVKFKAATDKYNEGNDVQSFAPVGTKYTGDAESSAGGILP